MKSFSWNVWIIEIIAAILGHEIKSRQQQQKYENSKTQNIRAEASGV